MDVFFVVVVHRNGKLMAIGDRIGLPDDVSVGYVIGMNHILYTFKDYFDSIYIFKKLLLLIIVIYRYSDGNMLVT